MIDILPVAWELILETDQELATAAGESVLMGGGGAEMSEKVDELLYMIYCFLL